MAISEKASITHLSCTRVIPTTTKVPSSQFIQRDNFNAVN